MAIVGTVVSNNAGLTAAIAAGAGAALLLTPLRGALQRRVNRFVFGTSADPFAVVDALVARLDAARDAPTAASAIVTTIASTTRLPYVAIELDSKPVAEHGVATDGVTRRFPIVRHGAALGDVVVSLPAGTIELTPRDQAVIDQIVRHAGPSAPRPETRSRRRAFPRRGDRGPRSRTPPAAPRPSRRDRPLPGRPRPAARRRPQHTERPHDLGVARAHQHRPRRHRRRGTSSSRRSPPPSTRRARSVRRARRAQLRPQRILHPRHLS